MSIRLRSSTAFAVLATCLAAPLAAQQHFFGEDLGWAFVLGAHPNSSAAQANFLAQLTGVGTEDFEGFSAGTNAPLGLVFPGAGSATLTGNGFIAVNSSVNEQPFGRNSTSGTQFWEVETSGFGSDFTINFGSSIAAFGFYGGDIGDFGAALTLQFFNGATPVDSWAPTFGNVDGDLAYLGYINTANPFTSVRFTSTGGGGNDFWAFDDMTIGAPEQVTSPVVPEPATLSLLATGLVGLAGFRRRRRK